MSIILSANEAANLFISRIKSEKLSGLSDNEFGLLSMLMGHIRNEAENGAVALSTSYDEFKHIAPLLTMHPNVIAYLIKDLGYTVKVNSTDSKHYIIGWNGKENNVL